MLSTSSEPIRNIHCGHDELVIQHRCKVCTKCWVYVTGNRRGHCPYGGPFTGWEYSHGASDGRTDDEENAITDRGDAAA